MSLIQSALEKANRSTSDHSAVSTPKITPVMPKKEKTASIPKDFMRPAPEKKPAVKIFKNNHFHEKSKHSALVFGAAIFLAVFTVFLGLYFIFSQPPAMTSAVVSQPAQANVAPVSAAPGFPRAKKGSRFQLSGITFSGEDRLALINNQVLAIGDKLPEGAIVKDIAGDRVMLEFEGKNIELSLR